MAICQPQVIPLNVEEKKTDHFRFDDGEWTCTTEPTTDTRESGTFSYVKIKLEGKFPLKSPTVGPYYIYTMYVSVKYTVPPAICANEDTNYKYYSCECEILVNAPWNEEKEKLVNALILSKR